ncbi:MAG: sulfatase-like hydrolase/transferase, partial [Opitutaceae bacterium]|nr:sulfatase-like hydrolase/transferase [Opitutaceae bacterium]
MKTLPALSRPLLVLCLFLVAALRAAPPNVIIVLTDDQGYGDLSAHGNPILRTPHLDRLHAESVRLTDFHAM